MATCMQIKQLKMMIGFRNFSKKWLVFEFAMPYVGSLLILAMCLASDSGDYLRIVNFDNGMKLCFLSKWYLYFGVVIIYAIIRGYSSSPIQTIYQIILCIKAIFRHINNYIIISFFIC